MNQAKVTIGIPVYNEERYLAETIESALNQTYNDISILISDNCSTDDSYKIAKDYEAKDSRIKVFKQPGILVMKNFEFLMEKAQTEYFCFLGGHDVLKENYVDEVLKIFNSNSKIIGVYPKTNYFVNSIIKTLNTTNLAGIYPQVEYREIVNEIKKEDIGDKFNTFNLNTYNCIKNILYYISAGSSFYGVYKREIMLKVYLKEEMNSGGNGDLGTALRMSAYGYVVPTPEVCSYFRVVRSGETPEEMDKRYKTYGIPENWRILLVSYPFKFISGLKSLSFNEKTKLCVDAYYAMQKRFNFSWAPLISFNFRSSKLKTYILLVFSYMRYIYGKLKNIAK